MCSCPVCTHHSFVHPQRRVMTGAVSVPVDVDLEPLVAALWRAGVVTVASCIDLSTACSVLWPQKWLEFATDASVAMNYRAIITRQLAFVRMLVGVPAAEAVCSAAESLPGAEVTIVGPLAQVAVRPVDLTTLLGAA